MRPSIKFVLIILAILLIGLLGFQSYKAIARIQTKPVAVEQATPVKTEAAALRVINDDILITGSITPETMVNVTGKIVGRLLTANFKEGDYVSQGQLLATIEATETAHSLQNAELSVTMANSNYQNVKENYERTQKLYNDGLISQQQFDAAKLGLQSAETQKRQAETNLSLLKNQNDYSRITAPLTGVILKKFFEAGAMASGPIYTIGSVGQVKIMIGAEEKLLSYLKPGQQVTLTVDSWPDQTFSGRITNIQPQIDPVTRTIPVEITANNGNRKLFPGMFAKVTITRRAANNVLAVPLAAVLENTKGKFVLIVDNGKAVKKPIETGLSDETYIEVASGLNAGDQIIVSGQHTAVENSPVEVVGGTNP